MYSQPSLLPIPGLVEDVVAVSADTLTTEERREATANRDQFFRDTDFLLGLRFADDEFADLYH